MDCPSSPVAVLGIPFDSNSSYLRGSAAAPPRIRQALYCPSANMFTENGIDLASAPAWRIAPDLTFPDPAQAFAQIESTVSHLLQQPARVISLGGDHSITYPILRAYGRQVPNLTILQLDAHPDTYDVLDGNRYSHACPFARIMEERLAARLVQVGIRTATAHQRQQAQRFAIQMIEMKDLHRLGEITFSGPLYLSLDMDCLDPAFAPGVSHHEPGGMTTRQVLEIIQRLPPTLVGADIVEYNPQRDLHDVTAMVAAKLLKEIIAHMLSP
ncbi:MAG: agmatinase [Anaerolineales bacterium]|nr:agmatinase [Anaerolineales bacterium]